MAQQFVRILSRRIDIFDYQLTAVFAGIIDDDIAKIQKPLQNIRTTRSRPGFASTECYASFWISIQYRPRCIGRSANS